MVKYRTDKEAAELLMWYREKYNIRSQLIDKLIKDLLKSKKEEQQDDVR